MEKKLSIGSCFAGIGGLELGLELTGGFETKWQIENNKYALGVLAKYWPNVVRYEDITSVEPRRLEPVDVICGGFPCQDVSVIGKRKGLKGKRSTLWGEMFRIICAIKPAWVVAENVPGLLSSDKGKFFGGILRDLATNGYDAQWGLLSAAGVGAPHLRKRVFIIAYSDGEHGEWRGEPQQSDSKKRAARAKSQGMGANVSDSIGGNWEKFPRSNIGEISGCDEEGRGCWPVEPAVDRVANGVPFRMDRLRCLGNAVVPQVAEKIGQMILNLSARNSVAE